MNFLKKIAMDIRGNYKTLILAFLIAAAFWIVVSINVFPTIEDEIGNISVTAQPTEYMEQNNLKIVGDFNDIVDIRIEGKRYDITGLGANDFTASVDLSQIRAKGTYTLPVNVTPATDSGSTVINVSPPSVTLVVDEIVSREFTVEGTAPNISLADEYYMDEITASPAQITLTGSSNILDKVTRVEARSVLSGEIRQSHETQSELIIYGSGGARIISDEIELSAESVSVNIPIYKQKELPLTFSLSNYPSNFDTDSLKYTIQPPYITVAAPDDSIDFISELDIGTIDISDIRLNQVATIPITLPDDYKNLSGNTNARIVWDISDYGKLDYTITDIGISNAPDNFNVSLITNEVTITAIGPSDRLAALNPNDFIVTANLLGTNIMSGAQDVALTITIKGAKQKCWVSGSYKATVYAQLKPEYIEE